MNERKFKIIEAKEITTEDGKKFMAYKVLATGGRKMDVRFVKGCSNVPDKPCVIVVDEDKANVDLTRRYPILWIKDIIRVEEFEFKNNLSEFFDEIE